MAKPCFRCDGTKQICNVCGESAGVCECDVEEFVVCPDCGGSGRGDVRADEEGQQDLGGEGGQE